MVTVPRICQTHLSLPSEPHCFILGQPLSLGPISLLTVLLPSAPMGYPSYSARKFSISCKSYWTILLVKAFHASSWSSTPQPDPGCSSQAYFHQTLIACHSHHSFHLMVSCFPNTPHQCLSNSVQTLFIGRPTSWWMPCPSTICIIFAYCFH